MVPLPLPMTLLIVLAPVLLPVRFRVLAPAVEAVIPPELSVNTWALELIDALPDRVTGEV